MFWSACTATTAGILFMKIGSSSRCGGSCSSPETVQIGSSHFFKRFISSSMLSLKTNRGSILGREGQPQSSRSLRACNNEKAVLRCNAPERCSIHYKFDQQVLNVWSERSINLTTRNTSPLILQFLILFKYLLLFQS